LIESPEALGNFAGVAPDLIAKIEAEYDRDTGAIGQLRDGHVDDIALERLLALLRKCPAATHGPLEGELVRLLWWMPWIAEWQAQRLEEEGKSAEQIRRAEDAIFKQLERILGVA
jgi:hypothetical protein